MNDLSQISIDLGVIPNGVKDYSNEFDCSGLTPPLISSSFTSFWFLSYASIEHIILYLSRLGIVAKLSKKSPSNREHIIVLYHVLPKKYSAVGNKN